MHYISFPGLNIEEFPLNRVAFSLFGRDIMWYGVIITCGIILAGLYAHYRGKNVEGITTDNILDYVIYLVIFGVIGARLYYVFTKFESFKADSFWDTLYNVIAVWEGGLAIYGGIIAGAIALIVVSLIKKINVFRAFDMAAPAVMIGQILGRWGNFFNAEAYGSETTLPWRMGIRPANSNSTIYVHPTFLYESLWNLIGFLIIHLLYKHKKFNGQIFLMYLSWYGFGRMFIEGLRTDSLYVGEYRISQVVGFLCFFFGAAILVGMLIVSHLRKLDTVKESVTSDTTDDCPSGASETSDTIETPANPPESSTTPREDALTTTDSFDISATYVDEDDEE